VTPQAAREREIAFQKDKAGSVHLEATPREVIDRYRSLRYSRIIQKDFMYRALGLGSDIAGKRLLDFGCGSGETSTQLAALGADVLGIDVSPDLVSLARRRAELDGVSHRAQFWVRDIVADPPPKDHFDLVLCSAVLHHVDYKAALPVLRSCLKPGGRIVIGEPIAASPLLRWLRAQLPIPVDASPDEVQFALTDIAAIAGHFRDPEIDYFNLFSRLNRFLPSGCNLEKASALTRALIVFLMSIDRTLAGIAVMRPFFGAVTIIARR